jgi:hypothetical protein
MFTLVLLVLRILLGAWTRRVVFSLCAAWDVPHKYTTCASPWHPAVRAGPGL